MGPAAAPGRLRRPRPAGLLHRAPLDDQVEPVEVHVYVSGRWIVTVRRCETRARRASASGSRRRDYDDEDEILYHVLDALADGWDPVIDDVDRRVDEVEEAVLERPQQRPAHDDLPAQAGGLRAPAPRRPAARRRSRGPVEAIHALEGLTHGSREWLRDVEAHIGRDRLRPAPPHRRPERAHGHVLQRQRQPPQPARRRSIAVGIVFFLDLDAGDRLLRPELRLPDRATSTPRRAFFAYELGALIVPTVILADAAVVASERTGWR